MGMQWTDDQRKVIESRDCSILVSAAAGSGKTAVLTQRILSKITDPEHPADVDRMLVVTFTNAAAAQMRERIGRAIDEALAADPGNVHLQRQSTLLHNAYIMTIDSFCLKVVRSHFQLIDLDPAFRIGDQDELNILRDEACREVLELFHERCAREQEQNQDQGQNQDQEQEQNQGQNQDQEQEQNQEQNQDQEQEQNQEQNQDQEQEQNQEQNQDQEQEQNQKKNADFLEFYRNYATAKSDDRIREMILKMYDFAQSNVDPEQWLLACPDAYCADTAGELYEQEWMKRLMDYFSSSAEYISSRYRKLMDEREKLDDPDACPEVLSNECRQAESLKSCGTLNEYHAVSNEIKFATWHAKKSTDMDKARLVWMKQERDQLKDEVLNLKNNYFAQTEEDRRELVAYTGRMMRVLVDLTRAFTRQFREKKQERNVVDFNDVAHYALDILIDPDTGEPTPAAMEYKSRFDEVMVDEYQDSNYVQEALLTAVSGISEGRENYFMVGDVKQSIYRFRLARPELFMEKYRTFQPGGERQRRIDLHANFRSRPEVIDFVNTVFRSTMRSDIGNIEYDEDAALYAGTQFEEDPKGLYRPEVLLLRTDKNAQEAGRQETQLIVDRIRRLLLEDPGLSYKDIVILMRSPGSRAAVFQEIMADNGIPVIVESKTGYFAAREIELVLNLLLLIDNPLQDIPLASVLTSYFGGLRAEDLAAVKSAYPQLSFREAVFAYAGCAGQADGTSAGISAGFDRSASAGASAGFGGDAPAGASVGFGGDASAGTGELRGKLRAFLELLADLRKKAAYTPAHELIEAVIHETGFYHYAGALPAGQQRQANLDKLFEMAVTYEKSGGQGLHGFNRYIERLKKIGTDYGEANLFGESEDAVRIMSIHKSKGLEFPVVFVTGLGNKFNEKDLTSNVVFHQELGCGLKFIDRTRHLKSDTLIRQAIAVEIKKDNLGEELRLLYVAMTRAERKLILTGIVPEKFSVPVPEEEPETEEEQESGLTTDIEDDSRGLDFYVRFHAHTYLDFILPAIADYKSCDLSVINRDEPQPKRSERCQKDNKDRSDYIRQASIVDDDAYRAVDEVFSHTYVHAGEGLPKQKVSVSEIKHRAMEAWYGQSEDVIEDSVFPQEQPVPYIPRFVQEREENRGALYGTAVHEFLRHFDYGRLPAADISERGASDRAAAGGGTALADLIEAEIDRVVSEGRLDADSGKSLNRASLLAFFASPQAERIRQADARGDAFREQVFTMAVDAARVWDDVPAGREILTQGIIDIFWIEEDGIVLLDYKTDRVKTPDELIGRYKTQLLIYAEALGRFYPELPVKEILIYSFKLNCTIPVNPD